MSLLLRCGTRPHSVHCKSPAGLLARVRNPRPPTPRPPYWSSAVICNKWFGRHVTWLAPRTILPQNLAGNRV